MTRNELLVKASEFMARGEWEEALLYAALDEADTLEEALAVAERAAESVGRNGTKSAPKPTPPNVESYFAECERIPAGQENAGACQSSGQSGPGGEEPAKRQSKPVRSKASVVVAAQAMKQEVELDELVRKCFPKIKSLGKAYDRIASVVGAPDDAKVKVLGIDEDDFGEGVGTVRGVFVSIEHPDLEMAERLIGVSESGQTFIKNVILEVKEDRRGTGIGTEIFTRQVANAAEEGFSAIHTDASGGPGQETSGYYVWPRFGYDKSIASLKEDHEKLGDAVAAKFPSAVSIREVMATEEGRKWWKDNGGILSNAKFDLSEGSWSRRILDAYATEKRRGRKSMVGESASLPKDDEDALERAWQRIGPEIEAEMNAREPEPEDDRLRSGRDVESVGRNGTKAAPVPPAPRVESYFSVCERDDEGRCLPSGQTGESKPEDNTIPPPTETETDVKKSPTVLQSYIDDATALASSEEIKKQVGVLLEKMKKHDPRWAPVQQKIAKLADKKNKLSKAHDKEVEKMDDILNDPDATKEDITKQAGKCDEALTKYFKFAEEMNDIAWKEIRKHVNGEDNVFENGPAIKKVSIAPGYRHLLNDVQQEAVAKVEKILSGAISVNLEHRISTVHTFSISPQNKQRAFFRGNRHGGNEEGIYLPEKVHFATVAHEFGHALETNYTIGRSARAFLYHRVGDEQVKPLGEGYESWEVGRDDKFSDAFESGARYVGKHYKTNDTEVVSMGLEKMVEDPVWFASKDPEYFKFILGVLDGSFG